MKISQEKKDKISEQILAFLYSIHPKPSFTAHIAKEIARDDEFIKQILLNLKLKGIILEINKNPKGIKYKRRSRWKMGDKTIQAYKNKQY